jgi:hypothetical protein
MHLCKTKTALNAAVIPSPFPNNYYRYLSQALRVVAILVHARVRFHAHGATGVVHSTALAIL